MSNELTQDVQVYINSLKDDKQDYINWLDSKGVSVSPSDTFTTLNTKAQAEISNGNINITENNTVINVAAYEIATINIKSTPIITGVTAKVSDNGCSSSLSTEVHE